MPGEAAAEGTVSQEALVAQHPHCLCIEGGKPHSKYVHGKEGRWSEAYRSSKRSLFMLHIRCEAG